MNGAVRGRMMNGLFLFILTFCFIRNVHAAKINVKNTLVWGPGLNTNFALPVRYFFIQVVDKNKKNITNSIGAEPFEITFEELSTKHRPRVYLQVLDRHDGSYIVRYRLYGIQNGLKISVTHQNKHVAQSPYVLKGFIQDESCYCPDDDINDWYDSIGCNQTYNQLEYDMNKFESLDMDVEYDKILKRFNQRYSQSLCHYVVLNNEIYRQCFGEHVGFKMFSDAILLSLTRKVRLPNVEFFMNLGDWPLATKNNEFLPIVSWCGSTDAHDIILPTYDLTESVLEMLGRQSLDIFSVQANTGPKWSDKYNVSFWRGRDSRQERLDLVAMSKQYPFLVNAALTHMFFFREPEHLEKYGPLQTRVSFYEFFKYKYQINIDGTVAAYRLPYLLAADSVVLKQDSNYYEHFYIDLKSNVHYIPFKRDLGDLSEKIGWAMQNDDEVRKIAINAQEYVREYLQPHHIFCYHVKFFEEYSKKLKSKVKLRGNMEHVKQTGSTCTCPKSKKFKTEL